MKNLVSTCIILCAVFVGSCNLPQRQNLATAQPTPTALPLPTPTGIFTPTPAVIQGTVRIWHSLSEAEILILEQATRLFGEIYPDVLFDVIYVPSHDLKERYETETREGTGPTILMGPAAWGQSLFEAGLVADLTGQISENLLSSLNSPALESGKLFGAQVGLPYTMRGVVLYRNKDLITIRADTFDELALLAQSSTQGEIIGAVLERGFLYSGAHLAGIGGRLADETGAPAFNDERGQAWLELLGLFEQAGPPSFMSDEDLVAFKQGHVGWIIDGTWNLLDIASAIGANNLAVDPWPNYHDGKLSGYVMADNLYLSSKIDENQRLAGIKFIEFFLADQVQSLFLESEQIPASLAVEPSLTITSTLLTDAIIALQGGTPYPILPAMELYTLNMEIALRAYLFEGMPAKDALQLAFDSIQSALLQANTTPTP